MSNDQTIAFAIWPHLVTMEGPAAKLASLLEALDADSGMPHNQWSMANTGGIGRRAMAARLRAQGNAVRRVGVAALTLPLSEAIERRARSAGVKCFSMHLPTR